MSLPLSVHYTLFDAARHLEQNDEKGALRLLPPLLQKGQITKKQFDEFNKIILEHKPLTLRQLAKDSSSKTIQRLFDEVLNTTDFSSTYSISIPFLGSSYTTNGKYEELKKQMFTSLSLNPQDSVEEMVKKVEGTTFNIWMLGRILNACINQNEKELSNKIALLMERLLKTSGTDCFSVWSRGYLSMYDAKKKEEMISATKELAASPKEKKEDNVQWAIVMNLQSISLSPDGKKQYEQQLKELKEFTNTSSVLEALRTIPPKDFRSWAMSLVLLAAKRMGDEQLFSELMEVMDQEIEQSPSKGDQMLAIEIANMSFSQNG